MGKHDPQNTEKVDIFASVSSAFSFAHWILHRYIGKLINRHIFLSAPSSIPQSKREPFFSTNRSTLTGFSVGVSKGICTFSYQHTSTLIFDWLHLRFRNQNRKRFSTNSSPLTGFCVGVSKGICTFAHFHISTLAH